MKRILIMMIMLLFFAAPVMAQEGSGMVTDLNQAFVSGSLVVKGEGAAPGDRTLSPAQKRIMAVRAAKIVAFRELAEMINGVSVFGETVIADASTHSDTIRTTVQGMIKGAQVVKQVYDPVTEMAIAYISMPLKGRDGLTGRLLPQLLPSLQPGDVPSYQPSLSASPLPGQSYDALIIDTTAYPFKPALVNRVIAENGDILYDPTKISQEILVERGAGDYTNEVGKARALLKERGANNPLVVNALGVLKDTDIRVASKDASMIYAANQQSNFLEGAKVVFVLK